MSDLFLERRYLFHYLPLTDGYLMTILQIIRWSASGCKIGCFNHSWQVMGSQSGKFITAIFVQASLRHVKVHLRTSGCNVHCTCAHPGAMCIVPAHIQVQCALYLSTSGCSVHSSCAHPCAVCTMPARGLRWILIPWHGTEFSLIKSTQNC